MKNFILLSIIGSLVMAALPAQAIITFEKEYGTGNVDVCKDVKQTPDGGYILAGNYMYYGKKGEGKLTLGVLLKTAKDLATDSTSDAVYALEYHTPMLIKVDSLGNLQWASWTNFTWSWSSYETVEPMPGGGYLCGGALDHQVFIVRIDSLGDTLWSRKVDTSINTYLDNFDMTKANDNYYTIVAGREGVNGNGTPYNQVGLICIDSLGNTLWTKTHGDTINWYNAYSIAQTNDHGYIITGYYDSLGPVFYDLFLLKVDSLGNKEWEKIYGGAKEERGYCVKQTPDGGYIVGGFSNSYGVNDSGDIWVLKTDSLGDTLWTKVLGGTGRDFCYSLCLTSDSCFVITGYYSAQDRALLYKLNANGDSIWSRFPNFVRGIGYSVIQTSDGGYAVGGDCSAGYGNYYLLKTDTAGCMGIESRPEDKLTTKPSKIKIYPNPSNSMTKIKYVLAKEGRVKLHIYNIYGQLVDTIVDSRQAPGEYNYIWKANKYSNGIYFVKLDIAGQQETQKIIIIK